MEKNKIMGKLFALGFSALLLMSCGSSNQLASTTVKAETPAQVGKQSDAVRKLTFVQKVSDNQVYAKNIVGNMDFTIRMGDKKISVDGSLRMRKDEVIRLQLFAPILGFEVGRLEFTPTYVLIIDRLHKEYIKADYTQVDFLQKQGITFYSLQALFWNQLLLPGAKKVSESDLKKFDADLGVSGELVPVSLKDGNMAYTWTAQRATGLISQADVKYVSDKYGTSGVTFKYGDFRNVGVKQFPATIDLTLATEATQQKREVNMLIKMKDIKTDDNWDAQTEVSSKYKQVSPQDVLTKILSL